MSESIQGPRGVRDILPDESWKWAYVLDRAGEIARRFGYSEVKLPIFEHTELFSRGVGDTTDIVEKEMYTFTDKGGRSITLRPEMTAGMMRSYVEHTLGVPGGNPAKLWGAGPMFRYERPQKGRYRQFWQLDYEEVGSENPLVDVEVIMTAIELFRTLGMRNLEVVINSVGCPKCRPVYREKLVGYLKGHFDELCDTCKSRLDRNPLRVLDCKEDHEIVAGAPDIFDSLCDECAEHFKAVTDGLTRLGIKYTIDKTLVRGLDYYTKTAFEVKSGDLGAQSAVCGGGRYDNLSESIGGPHVPSVGFAAGLDRVILVMDEQGCSFGAAPALDAYVVCPDPAARLNAMELMYDLRRAGLKADMDYAGRGMKAQMKTAVASGAKAACILGGDEAARGVVAVRDLTKAEQAEVPAGEVCARVAELAGRQ